MSACERCWCDAYKASMDDPEHSQTEHYQRLLKERENHTCIKEAVAEERESCAKLCESLRFASKEIAQSIRKRGDNEKG